MYLLHNIGQRANSNYNSIEEILASTGPISFDGIYQNVYKHRFALREKDITLFVMGDTVGGDNTFDRGMPFERYCDWNEIIDFANITKAKIGWHTWSHRNLCALSDEEIKKEITPPFPMQHFAYPYGNVDERVASLVQQAGYDWGWSVTQGNDSRFQRVRRYLNW